MNTALQFIFRDKLYKADVCIESSGNPYYILITLNDKRLVEEFGAKITIMTDYISRFATPDDFGELCELKESVFDALRFHPVFTSAAAKRWKAEH